MFDFGPFPGDALVASLLTFAQRLARFGLALYLIFEPQSTQHFLPLTTAIRLVRSYLFARVVSIQHRIKVVAFEPKTHADVQRVMLKLGQLLEVPDAARIWRAIDAGVSAAAQSLPASARGTCVYFEVNQGPYAASESSFIGQTLTRLGAKNIVPAQLGPFPKLNPEYIVRANPDLIMIGQRSADGLMARPGWQSLRALREQRICIFPPEQADMLVRPGPRMAEAARLMAQCLVNKAPQASAGAQP